ncbi:hypothetical protein DFH94DRAFT_758156, partial [Russula ochroleuca]
MEKAIDKREDHIKGPLPSLIVLLVFSGRYANGVGTHKNCQDTDCAFRLFNLAAKYGHLDATAPESAARIPGAVVGSPQSLS